jgi:hypothetical protein
MAVGALAAVAALVAVIQLAPWKGSKAAGMTQPAPEISTAPSQPTTTQPTPSATAPPVTEPVPTPSAQPAVSSAPAQQQTPVTGRPKPAPSMARVTQQPQQPQPPAMQPQTPVQQPVAGPAPAQHAAAPPVETGPSRAEMQQTREALALLNNRAATVHTSLQNLQRSQASQGYGIGGQYTGPAGLMDTYLRGANDALNANDVVAAKDFSSKAERQLEILEKLFHL